MKEIFVTYQHGLLLGLICSIVCTSIIPITLQNKGNLCNVAEISVNNDVCISKCTQQIKKECSQNDLVFFGQRVCAFDSLASAWVDFPDKCDACSDPTIVGFKNEQCQQDNIDINVGNELDSSNWNNDLPGVPICDKFQIYTKSRGCIRACSHPEYKKCGDFFIEIFKPSFCALSKNGEWRNFTFECQACTNKYPNTDYVGVSAGKCETDITNEVPSNAPIPCRNDKGCQASEKCFAGSCLKMCSGKLCRKNSVCINGECVSPPAPACMRDNDCGGLEYCKQKKCLVKEIKCGNYLCKATDKCAYNRCIPEVSSATDLCGSTKCIDGYSCFNGVCSISNS